MLTYLDESYASKEKLLLGALFIPTKSSRAWLHQEFIALKNKANFLHPDGRLREIKYNKISDRGKLKIAQQSIDLFLNCPDCYFRSCIIPYSEEKLEKVGRQRGIPRKLKEAMLYTHSTIQLLNNNIPEVRNAVLLMDEITRAKGDRFDEMVRQKLGVGTDAIFRHIGYVKSSDSINHTIQICDLLLGALLNENYPCKKGSLKNEFREYVKTRLGLPSLNEAYWKKLTKKNADAKHPKYNVRCFGVPYKFLEL